MRLLPLDLYPLGKRGARTAPQLPAPHRRQRHAPATPTPPTPTSRPHAKRGLSPCRRHPDMEQAACLHTSRTAACVPAPPKRVLVTTITSARYLAAPGWERPFFREGKGAAGPLCRFPAGAARERRQLGQEPRSPAGQRRRPGLARRCRAEGGQEERIHPLLGPAPLRTRSQLYQQRRVEGPCGEIQRDGTA